jgi:cold shock CspA family protein
VIGEIKLFKRVERYGFIIPDGKTYKDKADVFFHENNVEGGVPGTLEEGTEVEYEVIPHKRDKALSVKLMGRRYAPVSEFPKSGGGTKKGGTHGD